VSNLKGYCGIGYGFELRPVNKGPVTYGAVTTSGQSGCSVYCMHADLSAYAIAVHR